MGEKQDQPFQLAFDSSLKIDFQGSLITSDGGPILVRELDHGKNPRLPRADLPRRLFGSMVRRIEALAVPAGRRSARTGKHEE